MQITKNFTLEEFIASETARTKNIINTPDILQIANIILLCEKILQPVRDKFDAPISVTSGFRSQVLNLVLKGASTSQHLRGEAADIVSSDNNRLWKLMCDMVKKGEIVVGQLINEHNLSWIHVSLPDSRHRNNILYL